MRILCGPATVSLIFDKPDTLDSILRCTWELCFFGA
nr:MAG TPA: hypothetical protein [Caudoviricetes sp.]DAQ90320.1 MAG TPA: hypothetical protein [Caudoviricetes sp.]